MGFTGADEDPAVHKESSRNTTTQPSALAQPEPHHPEASSTTAAPEHHVPEAQVPRDDAGPLVANEPPQARTGSSRAPLARTNTKQRRDKVLRDTVVCSGAVVVATFKLNTSLDEFFARFWMQGDMFTGVAVRVAVRVGGLRRGACRP